MVLATSSGFTKMPKQKNIILNDSNQDQLEERKNPAKNAEEAPLLDLKTKFKIDPTAEQVQILSFARTLKRKRKGDGSLTRIIAGAGTGKTTALMMLSNQLLSEQRFKVLYLVFNKQAQSDAQERFSNLEGVIDCKTMHGAALKNLSGGDRLQICSDNELQKKIYQLYSGKVENWLHQHNINPANQSDQSKKAFRLKVELCCFYIFKTIENFYRSDEPLESLTDSDRLTYYVAKVKHKDKIGFSDITCFYTDLAAEIWKMMSTFNICLTHDAYLKLVQIRGMIFTKYNAILIDESQDLTSCQIDLFVHQQIKGSKHVFLVGDSCQTIYSFRGARSKFITMLENTNDFHLTQSFRFGQHIAFIANTCLWIKEKSPQSSMFIPYRLTGMSPNPGLIHGENVQLEFPYTIVARHNLTLILKAISLLSQYPTIKISMNGGSQSFSAFIDQTLDIYRLACGEKPHLPKFAGFDSLNAFKVNAIQFEQSQDLMMINLLESLGEDLPRKIQCFKESVLNRPEYAMNYDVQLSTTHQAKGLEWDRVQVEDDFLELDVQVKKNQISTVSLETLTSVKKLEMEFALSPYGDDINLWYVAVTRAKKELHLPPRYWKLIDMISTVKQNNPILKINDTGDVVERFKKEEYQALKDLFASFKNVYPK